jgi:hypothetical protein
MATDPRIIDDRGGQMSISVVVVQRAPAATA